MQIKRLRLTGFKSFVDPSDLAIAPGLTGVVGPNGCGKSNLLEALRWTMGENSPRSMRGAGMEDVIFAGTATRPPRDFAEVSLLAEVDEREVEVVRRIERGAGSAYRIDGRDVRARDVQLLFADAATGAHSPALVSQNRISAVISAKPAERRQMLEEAAGIAGLHVRRKEAETRLRATEANLARLDEVMADAEARVASLRRQARAAERYRALSDRIRVAEARLIYARWRDAAAAADAAKTEAAAAEARVVAATAALALAEGVQATATATVATTRADALAARERAGDAAHRLATLRAERASAERRLADLADASRRLAADRAREGTLATDAAEALARLAAEIESLDAAAKRAAAAVPALDASIADAERAARDAEVALAQALARQASELAEARIARAALTTAEARVARATREVAGAEAALAALPAPAPLAVERDTAASARVVALEAAEAARVAIADADGAEATAIGARDAAQTARAAARGELAALDGEIAALERAARATPPGNRLLDRVAASPGYERALAAALGDDLSIGFDPKADAHWTDPGTIEPGVSEALAAHVTAPGALARRLAQVIVAAEDDGRTLAPGQRLVTHAGVMRRWDGLVVRAGGAAAADRLERANRLAALHKRRPALAHALEAAEARLAAADAAIAAARQAATAARGELARADTAARDAQAREDRAAAALERLAGQRDDLDRRLARAATERDEAEAERVAALGSVAGQPDATLIAGEVAGLQRDADRARGAVAEARAARTALDRDAALARDRLAAAQADVRNWRARAGDAAKRIADTDKREREIAAEVQALDGRPEALAQEVAALEVEHEALRRAADEGALEERRAEAALREAEERLRGAGEALATAREARAGAAARVENHELRRVEMGRVSGERFECPAPVLPSKAGFESASVGEVSAESAAHERLTMERERIGPVNLVAERELAELEAAALNNAAEREELAQAVNRLRGSIGTLNREGRQRLLAAFEAVDGHFRRLFTTLFDGGQAHLALIDSDDPLEAGLEIMAQPPGKRLSALTLLSGGEQALTAVALIFGLFLTNPAPICVLDEVDAPLDDANIERFCDLLDRMSRETDTRYLIVTHNAVTMSRMHRLFGVTMIERGVSRLVSVDLQAAAALAAE
jgi:chromosome segregation protein